MADTLLDPLENALIALDAAIVTVRGSREFRDNVFALLEGTPFAAPVGDDYEGLYGRLRSALLAAFPHAEAPPTPALTRYTMTHHVGKLTYERAVYLAAEVDAEIEHLARDRDEYKALASVGTWHADCRPNRRKAAEEIQKSQQRIDALAEEVARLTRERDEARAQLAAKG